MDPNVNWRAMNRLPWPSELGQAAEMARELLAWLDKGGFPPDGQTEESTRAKCKEVIAQAIKQGAWDEM